MKERINHYLKVGARVGAAAGIALAGSFGNPQESRLIEKIRVSAIAEAQSLPTELPPHIIYYRRSEQRYLEGSARVIKPLMAGDIWLAQAQKIQALGVDYNINPEANPGRAIVFAVGATNDLDLDFRTVPGVYTWTGLESSSRTGSDFIQDIVTAGRVQASRAQIPGNCIPSGCGDVLLIAALGHKDGDGVVRFDAIPDERYTK